MSVWVKTIEERNTNVSYEPSQVPRAIATPTSWQSYVMVLGFASSQADIQSH